MAAKRFSFTVHGSVQGVSYRYFTRKKALAYNLTGWVRNTSNGKVEGEAQGAEEALEKLLKDLESGPSHADVEKVDREEKEVADGETGFNVRG